MTNSWDRFAERNAEFYILTSKEDYSTKIGKDKFFESGEIFTDETIREVWDLLPSTERALEIGCGVGRLTLPHSGIFKEVFAVDVSSVMLDKLNANAIEFKKKNITTFLPSDNWDSQTFDYAYSFIVFQHIDKFSIIREYIARISGSLKKEGIAQLQFDTRSHHLLYSLRNMLPDILLPTTQKAGIRRIRRDAEKMREVFVEYNLEVVNQMFRDSERHTFILRKR